MSTVHHATYEVLRSLGMTTIFGNPGSNELPFLNRLPSDFRYILALHEGAGLAIADGYSQATGRPVLVNLHAAAGVGQAMGSLVNAQILGTPLVRLSESYDSGLCGGMKVCVRKSSGNKTRESNQ
jgi:benzoylformate decarboxylase